MMMTCTRCQGLMLEEQMIDMEGGYGEMWSRSWRCFNCGHRDDAVLQHHRQLDAKRVAGNLLTVPAHEATDLPWESEEVEPLAA
ncbi:MAG: hypothetical protein OEV99_00015 [Nitrospira sp.]|nr:hypothetical protein [Nitrospira sp.]MDH4368196.1 hypothetical protein [Nitrospira sp.]MDH5499243.1 hypothetical protein [Nitrospira sp.]MDH5723949.1 hypothetical protein [Nitrospira sp.]